MRHHLAILLSTALLSACSGNPLSGVAQHCESGLRVAYQELNFARTNGFSGSVEYTKAAGLLTAAKIQYEFGKYPNCVNKVNRARAFIRKSQG